MFPSPPTRLGWAAPEGPMQLPPLGKPQWPCLLLLRGEIGTTGLGICPTLSLIPGSRFLGPTANSRTQAGVGSKGVCVCVCVCARACTHVHTCAALLGSQFSVKPPRPTETGLCDPGKWTQVLQTSPLQTCPGATSHDV